MPVPDLASLAHDLEVVRNAHAAVLAKHADIDRWYTELEAAVDRADLREGASATLAEAKAAR